MTQPHAKVLRSVPTPSALLKLSSWLSQGISRISQLHLCQRHEVNIAKKIWKSLLRRSSLHHVLRSRELPQTPASMAIKVHRPLFSQSHLYASSFRVWQWTVFAWYLRHSLSATPINPRTPIVNVLKRDHSTVPSPSALTDPPPSAYSLSVITPPAITKQLLKEAKEAGVPAVWLQPGSFDDEILAYAKANFKAAIGGEGGEGGEGWCVLVDGEEGLRLAEREWSRL